MFQITNMENRKCRKRKARGFKSGNQEFLKRKCNKIEIAEVPAGSRSSERQRNQKNSTTDNSDNEYFISKKERMEILWNAGFKGHSHFSPTCGGLLKLDKNLHIILSTAWSLYCDTCEYGSQPVKMYDEYYRDSGRSLSGSKNSTLNDSLGLGLLTSPIGTTVFHELFLTLGINPGSKNGLSNLLNKCGQTMLDIGENVLKETKDDLKEKFTADIDVTIDTRYNNPIFSAHTPFQGGTQATTTLVEEVSGNRKVIGVITSSKLCTTGKRMRKLDKTIQCPGHFGCTANLKAHESIGNEAKYAEQAATLLKDDNFNLRYAGLDGDGKQKKGIKVVFDGAEFQICSRHFAASQRKKIKTYEFSDGMLKSSTKKQKDKYKDYFAREIMSRCTAEFNGVHNKCKKEATSLTSMKKQMNTLCGKLKDTIVQCYLGKHHKCKLNSFVCHPPGKPWSKKSLPKVLKDSMTMTKQDKQQVAEFIDLRFGPKAVEQTFLNMNTQKVEAVNRLYLKTNPKCVTSVRNFRPRILSAVIQTNLGFAAACMRLQSSSHHQICESVRRRIIDHDRHILLLHNAKTKKQSKYNRIQTRAELIQLHEETQGRGDDGDGYVKEADIAGCSTRS